MVAGGESILIFLLGPPMGQGEAVLTSMVIDEQAVPVIRARPLFAGANGDFCDE